MILERARYTIEPGDLTGYRIREHGVQRMASGQTRAVTQLVWFSRAKDTDPEMSAVVEKRRLDGFPAQ